MSGKRNIINIINFIRGVDERQSFSLVEPVIEQIKLIRKHSLPATFLLQFDALNMREYTQPLLCLDRNQFEFGLWFEIERSLIETAGLTWKGNPDRYFDPNPIANFPGSYTKREREILIDICFDRFKEVFGEYPETVGAWMIDAYSLKYMSEKYNITASCNCKDQWGTDGYTVWGGYYNCAYYPSVNNVLCPANTLEKQINVPIFRMLGSDPIYQYDLGLAENADFKPDECQKVCTLEPVYKYGGGNKDWVDWFFGEMFNGLCLSYSYTQTGQENSFGWKAMQNGLEYQLEKIAFEAENGNITVEKICDSARWFRNKFTLTPVCSIAALNDIGTNNAKSVWYNCKNYRCNLYFIKNRFIIRDIFIFNEDYRELYIDEINENAYYIFDNLPVMDGNRFSGNGKRAGIFLVDCDGNMPECGDIKFAELNDSDMELSFPADGHPVKIQCSPSSLRILFEETVYNLEIRIPNIKDGFIKNIGKSILSLEHKAFEYNLVLKRGYFIPQSKTQVIMVPEINGNTTELTVSFKN